jgi:protein phosphatase PTC7
MIIRSSSVFYRQKTQTHFFNCPRYVPKQPSCSHRENLFFFRVRQLAKVPSVIEKLSNEEMDSPEDADIYETKLRDGDLIIAYVSKTLARHNRKTHLHLFLLDGRIVRQRLQS